MSLNRKLDGMVTDDEPVRAMLDLAFGELRVASVTDHKACEAI
jgi:hypothetical protein